DPLPGRTGVSHNEHAVGRSHQVTISNLLEQATNPEGGMQCCFRGCLCSSSSHQLATHGISSCVEQLLRICELACCAERNRFVQGRLPARCLINSSAHSQ